VGSELRLSGEQHAAKTMADHFGPIPAALRCSLCFATLLLIVFLCVCFARQQVVVVDYEGYYAETQEQTQTHTHTSQQAAVKGREAAIPFCTLLHSHRHYTRLPCPRIIIIIIRETGAQKKNKSKSQQAARPAERERES
jgi:hypothetical protein